MGKVSKSRKRNKNIILDKKKNRTKATKSKNNDNLTVYFKQISVIDGKASRNILDAAKKQRFKLEDESCERVSNKQRIATKLSYMHDENVDVTENNFMDCLKISHEDFEAFDRFHCDDSQPGKPELSEIIIDKITAKQNDIRNIFEKGLKVEEIDYRVQVMYEGVRDVMKRFRSGKVPKALKIIPKLRNWEQILFLTEPHNWSAAAIFQGTRIFCSVLSQSMTQRFYSIVLLPRIRDDLCEYKKLNMHLYNALRRSLFKPAAFMKGIILPLLESGDCTLREAIIFGSVIAKNSIPVLHSSACLLKICEMRYTGVNSIFIRIFLNKRYALPYRVVDAAVFHFLRFENEQKSMPVLWHQSLLTFVQRYKNDISSAQKEFLNNLIRKQIHPKITPDIRRELHANMCRDIEMVEFDNTTARIPNNLYTDKDVEYNKS